MVATVNFVEAHVRGEVDINRVQELFDSGVRIVCGTYDHGAGATKMIFEKSESFDEVKFAAIVNRGA